MQNKSKKATTVEHQTQDFLLVGIGASAGGIEALKVFFSNLPDQTGMAYVIVLHLSKDFESNLHLILQKVTNMPVVQITQAQKVEADHVYVIPPGKHLELTDGIIHLKELEKLQGKHITIDHFFRSLANVYGRRAVCVVLSGSGSDGTLGLRHVKGRNGFAMVQDPEDAQFDSMPVSAIATGLADVILPASKMGAKLITVCQTTEQFHLTADDPKVEESLKDTDAFLDLLAYLKLRTGNDFFQYKRPTLLRRIARHLQIHEVPDIPSYLRILRARPDEAPFLVRNLLINVTNFFRDREAFEKLEADVIPILFKDKTSADEVRVWVAGCSSGEEAYSMAILLSEYAAKMKDPPNIQVFASDVDSEAVAQAKEGHYAESIIDDVTPERLQKYFTKDKTGYKIQRGIRERVLFATHNLLSDPPFSRLDMVSCRNVLIYINRETQEKVLQVFYFSLKDGGVLFLGTSESAEKQTDLFSIYDKKNQFYRRRTTANAYRFLPQMPVLNQQVNKTQPTAISHHRQPLPTSYNLLHHRLLNQYMPASVLVNGRYDILHLSESVGRYLRFVGGDLSPNLLKLVLPALRNDLRATLFAAKQQGHKETSRLIRLMIGDEKAVIRLIAEPTKEQELMEGAMLVLFQEEKDTNETWGTPTVLMEDSPMERVVNQLEEELQHTREQLQMTIAQYETSVEELRTSNEDQQAINEELRSTSEELETGKEEMHSVNEELVTINQDIKEKMEEISRVNADLQNLMASTNIGTVFLDRNLRIKRYTPQIELLFNIMPNDVGRPLYHLTHHFGYNDFKEDGEKVLANLQPIEREIEDRDKRSFLLRYFPYRTEEDKIDGVVLTFVDITERKKTEMASLWLSSVIEATADAVIHFSSDGTIMSWNMGAERIFGYTTKEAVGQKISLLTPPGETEQAKYLEALQQGKPIIHKQLETRCLRKDGQTVPAALTALVFKKGNEDFVGATVMVEDITERKQTQGLLKANMEEMETLMNVLPIAVYVSHDPECKVITANPAGYQLLEMQGDDDRNVSKSAPLEERPTFRVFRKEVELATDELPMQRAARTGRVAEEETLELRFEDDTRKYIYAYALPLFDEHKKPRGAVAAMMDITDRKRAEVELREKNKELEQFAYVASHDLQEPLNTIHSFIELIEEEERPTATMQEYMQYVKSSSNRLTMLIIDLLKHSRIGSQGEKEEVDCGQLVQKVLSDMKATIELKNAEVLVGQLPTVTAFPIDLRLLFQNLLSNALKFHRKNVPPKVVVSAFEEGKYWHFIIEDNGIGIDEKYLDKIFIIFQRLHVEEEYPGTGIGLANCKKIVDVHNGKIWLESEPGKGSKFHFTIEKAL